MNTQQYHPVLAQLHTWLNQQPSVLWPVLYMLAIFGLSSVPGVIPEDAAAPYQIFNWVPPALQNLLHIPVYAGLAFLWRWYLAVPLRALAATLMALLITISYGVFDEWYQLFVPGRYASLTDVLFNSIGAGLGVLAYSWINRTLYTKTSTASG
jgi:VanZ family protein